MWLTIACLVAFIAFLPDVVFAPIVAMLWLLEQTVKGINALLH